MIVHDIRPMLWGMGYLTFGFIMFKWVGLPWGLMIMAVVGLVGVSVGIWLITSGRGGKENGG